jgi:hypothetical protein
VNIHEQTDFTGFVAPHYCQFPTDAWPVDRTANYFEDDPTAFCHDWNYHLRLGGRGTVERSCSIDLTVPRNQECLKLYQSFACTIACPEYGKAYRFNKLCYRDIHRLREVCDDSSGFYESFYDCLNALAPIPYEYVDEDEKDCQEISPSNLIHASGQFEHDYCFFGDRARCNIIKDCKLEELEAPCCHYNNQCCRTWCGFAGGNRYYISRVGFKFAITTLPLNGGKSCEAVIDEFLSLRLGESSNYPFFNEGYLNSVMFSYKARTVVDYAAKLAYGGLLLQNWNSVETVGLACRAPANTCSILDPGAIAAYGYIFAGSGFTANYNCAEQGCCGD